MSTAQILTPPVAQAKQTLLAELKKTMKESGVTRDAAEAALSSILSGLWNEASTFAALNLPAPDARRGPRAK